MTASTALPLLSPASLSAFVDYVRLDASRRLHPARRSALGQFFTPASVASLMASLSSLRREKVRLLDAGAGVGVLTASWISQVCTEPDPPRHIEVVAYEVDDDLVPHLRNVLHHCQRLCESVDVRLDFTIRRESFIRSAVTSLGGGFFGTAWPEFDCAVLNPPYKKFRTDSEERILLREAGIETSNLYTAFVALALRGLTMGGELIAITPRSFCNGPYFTPFRKDLLRLANLTHVHVFDARDGAFVDDEVLQENIVFRVERASAQQENVVIEWSTAGERDHTVRREVPFAQVVRPEDADAFIHIAPDEWDDRVAGIIQGLQGTLEGLDVSVSTGRVVDFRAKPYLRAMPEPDTVPLIYPTHFSGGKILWPKPASKKPNALMRAPDTEGQLNPTGDYILVKRFSSKEERRRVAAAVFTPEAAPGPFVAFENHLNYYHRRGQGLPRALADGLVGYLNSTLVDSYFRQFNGHTQVNATDLRKLHYPTIDQLEEIGRRLAGAALEQEELDDIVEEVILNVSESDQSGAAVQQRIREASTILKALGLPKEQTNDRAALTLLALVNVKPDDPWHAATAPLRGVTPIMEFAADHYGKLWKPNTRETVRRRTLHQFRDAGVVTVNPDDPSRPVNSPRSCYRVPDALLDLVRSFGSSEWDARLPDYLASAGMLAARYASERDARRIPLRVREGLEITLSPGGQNELIEKIVSEFCPLFTPGAIPVYIGDADKKWGYFDDEALSALGVSVGAHGKMPDVVVHHTEQDWLVLIEAVTSHGPIDPKRRGELKELFSSSSVPLVFVTAFLTRRAMNKHLSTIAWETEVWVAESPTHMIHFNGERFLGPYDSELT